MKKIFELNLSKREKIVLVLLGVVFLISRLYNLTILPIFTDEAIYIRWAEIAWHIQNFSEARGLFFIPLTDGKQPLFMWIAGFLTLFMKDHVVAGRLPSVVSGLIAMYGMWLVAYELFKNKRVAWIASAIYLVLPFTLLYDRMALADSMLAMFGIWSMYLSLVLIRTLNLKVAIILGVVYGLGLLTKSPALFYWLLAPMTLLFIKNNGGDSLNLSHLFFWKWSKDEKSKLFKWMWLWLLAVVIGQAIQFTLRLSGMYHMIARKNTEFLISREEFIEKPFALLAGNMTGMSTWFYGYLGVGFVLCAFAAVVYGILKRDRRVLYLFVLFILPWLSSASFGKVLYPRYLLYFTPPLLLLVAYGLSVISFFVITSLKLRQPIQKALAYSLFFLLVSAQSIQFSYLLLTDPTKAPMPLQDKDQYVEDWASGYGVNEAYAFLKNELDTKGSLAIGTEGTFGLMPYALQIMFSDEIYNRKGQPSRLFIDGYWPFNNIPQQLMEYSASRPTYFLVYQREAELFSECPVELVKTFTKPGGKHTIRIYKVKGLQEYKPIQCTDAASLYKPIVR